MRKKYITIALGFIILCLLLAGAFFYGKSQNDLPTRTIEEERASAEESLKTKGSSSCADDASKQATDRLKELDTQVGSEESKSSMEAEIRKQLRTSIIDCSL